VSVLLGFIPELYQRIQSHNYQRFQSHNYHHQMFLFLPQICIDFWFRFVGSFKTIINQKKIKIKKKFMIAVLNCAAVLAFASEK
jgi:hypothetical protein